MPQTGGRIPREVMGGSILRVRSNGPIPCFQEKPRADDSECPYRKPTQVGGVRNPRRLREPSSRNFANYCRNFGRRQARAPCRPSRSKRRRVAESRGWRLFSKNTALCQVVRRRIGCDACPVPEG